MTVHELNRVRIYLSRTIEIINRFLLDSLKFLKKGLQRNCKFIRIS